MKFYWQRSHRDFISSEEYGVKVCVAEWQVSCSHSGMW